MTQRILVILLVMCGLTILLWQNHGCEGNTKSPPYSGYSQTIDDSKKNGVFEFEVVPHKSNLILDSGFLLKIKAAWVENTWSKQVLMIGKPLITKYDAHQLILNLDAIENTQQRTNHFYYFLGNKPIGNYVHVYCDRIDTIKVPLYREISPKLPSKKIRKAFDSLTFVRRPTSL